MPTKISKEMIKEGVLEPLGVYNRRTDLTFAAGGTTSAWLDIIYYEPTDSWYMPNVTEFTFGANTDPSTSPDWSIVSDPTTEGFIYLEEAYLYDDVNTIVDGVNTSVSDITTVVDNANSSYTGLVTQVDDYKYRMQALVERTAIAEGSAGIPHNYNALGVGSYNGWSINITATSLVVRTLLGDSTHTLSSLSLICDTRTVGVNGRLTSDAISDGWWGVYVIYNPTTLTKACGIAPSHYGNFTLPTGYTHFFYVGSACFRSGSIVPFDQSDGVVSYNPMDFGASITLDTIIPLSLSVALNTLIPNYCPERTSAMLVRGYADLVSPDDASAFIKFEGRGHQYLSSVVDGSDPYAYKDAWVDGDATELSTFIVGLEADGLPVSSIGTTAYFTIMGFRLWL